MAETADIDQVTDDDTSASINPDATTADQSQISGSVEPSSDDQGSAGQDASDGRAHKEAARYRTQLRSVEAERDVLAGRLAALERREVDRLVGDKLADPGDFTADLGELRDDDGNIDPAKVSAALDELVKAKPHYAKQRIPARSGATIAGGGYSAPTPRMGSIFGS